MVVSWSFKNDGVVHRVSGAGCSIVLGVPVSSQNDAERAARVAIDLQDAIAGINLSLQTPLRMAIGVAIGDVLVEQEVRASGRQTRWSFFGSSHEFADRLAEIAMDKEILLGGQVYRRIRREFVSEDIDMLRLGADETAQAYRLVGPKTSRERINEVRGSYRAFHGRELELKMLRNEYRRALMEGVFTSLVLWGEQGVGKSTLVEEFLRGLDPRDVRVVRGVTNPFDLDVPLGGMSSLVAELLRLGPRTDLRHVRTTLETRIMALFQDEDDSEREMLMASVGAIFNLRSPGSTFDELPGEARRQRMTKSLKKLLRRFGEKKPFVVAIEDAQYIDDLTLDIMSQVLDGRQDAPMLIVMTLTTASTTPPERWSKVFRARYVKTERLGELAGSEAMELAKDLLAVDDVDDDELAAEIVERAGGSPFYIKEIVEVLRDRGVLRDPAERERAQLDRAGSYLPTSVEGVIIARIDQLELKLKAALQRVALLPAIFELEQAARIVDAEADDVLVWLEELVDHKLLERVARHKGVREGLEELSDVGDQLYRFCNALTQEVVSRTLVPEVAKELHRELAAQQIAEAQALGVWDRAQIAMHLDHAGQTDEAASYYLDAAREALERFGAAESLRLCERALERAADGSDVKLGALEMRELSMRALGTSEEYRDALDQLAAYAKEHGARAQYADALLRLARFFYDQGDFEEAERHIAEGRVIGEELGLPRVVARSYHFASYIKLDLGELDAALDLLEQAIGALHWDESDRVEDEKMRQEVASCLNTRGVVLRRRGRLDAALDAYSEALELLGEGARGQMSRFLRINRGLALVYLGRPAESLEVYREVLARTQELGHRRDEATVLINIGHAYQVLGRVDDALAHIKRGIYLSRRMGAQLTVADGEITRGASLTEREDFAQARDALERGLRLSDAISNEYMSVQALLGLARLGLAMGSDPSEVQGFAMRGLERSEAAGMGWGVMCSKAIMARAFAAMGDGKQAAELAREAVEILEAGEQSYPEEVWWALALVSDAPEERARALTQARALVEARAELIEDELDRAAYLARPMHHEILSAARAQAGSK